MVDHSCAPNMSKVLLGDYLFLRASRDILMEEELTQHYCDIRMPVEMRVQELQQVSHAFTHPVSYCLSPSHTHSDSLSLVLVVMIRSKELKTKISHTHSLILPHPISQVVVISTHLHWLTYLSGPVLITTTHCLRQYMQNICLCQPIWNYLRQGPLSATHSPPCHHKLAVVC